MPKQPACRLYRAAHLFHVPLTTTTTKNMLHVVRPVRRYRSARTLLFLRRSKLRVTNLTLSAVDKPFPRMSLSDKSVVFVVVVVTLKAKATQAKLTCANLFTTHCFRRSNATGFPLYSQLFPLSALLVASTSSLRLFQTQKTSSLEREPQ